jgi:archaellum component FlaC
MLLKGTVKFFKNVFVGLSGDYVLQQVYDERMNVICNKLDKLDHTLNGNGQDKKGIVEIVIRMDERLKQIGSSNVQDKT